MESKPLQAEFGSPLGGGIRQGGLGGVVQVQNKGDGLVQNIGNTLIKVFGSDKLLDALEKEWTYGSTDGVCVESVAGG
jgi:hypothetical protein